MDDRTQYGVNRLKSLVEKGWVRKYILLFLCSLVAFGSSLDGELVGDSRELIGNNDVLTRPWEIRDMWLSNYWGNVLYAGNYRPFTVWTLALNRSLNEMIGLDPFSAWSYRWINLLVHAGVVGLVFAMAGCWGLRGPGQWAAAVGFAWHPLHVEAVTSAVGRADCLAALWGMVFLYWHWRGNGLVWAVLALGLSLWSKESGIAFFAVAIWMDQCWAGRRQRRPWSAYAVYVAVMALWFWVRASALGDRIAQISSLDNPLFAADLLTQLQTALVVQFEYLKLQVWPVHLSSDYSWAHMGLVESWLDGRLWGLAVLGGLLAAIALVKRRHHPEGLFFFGAYLLLCAPTANVFTIVGTIMGERLAYAPSIMSMAAMGIAVGILRARWKGSGQIAVMGLLCAWLLLCIIRGETWENRAIYHRTQLDTAPNSARARLGYGVYLLQAAKTDSAEEQFSKALSIYPQYAEAFYNRGNARAALGKWSLARGDYERSVALNAGLSESWFNLGLARQKMGDAIGAVAAYERALSLRGDDAQAWFNLAIALREGEHYERALGALQRVCSLLPQWSTGWRLLANTAADAGRKDLEEFARERFLELE